MEPHSLHLWCLLIAYAFLSCHPAGKGNTSVFCFLTSLFYFYFYFLAFSQVSLVAVPPHSGSSQSPLPPPLWRGAQLLLTLVPPAPLPVRAGLELSGSGIRRREPQCPPQLSTAAHLLWTSLGTAGAVPTGSGSLS